MEGLSMRSATTVGLASVLAAVVVAAPLPQRDEREEQREAVAAIRKLGGEVSYDYQRPKPDKPNVFDPEAKPQDRDALPRVVRVSLRDTEATDDDLKVLAKFPDLENLDLTGTRITGAGLAHLERLKNLRSLCLWRTQADDAGLGHIKGLTKMWQLVLDETQVTDAGLVHLKEMTGLEEWLGLTKTRVTDAGLKHLEGFTALKSLNLRHTQVTKGGIRKLRAALPGTNISFAP
jgi:hypothetical protein